jgi:hypothetical protein
MDRRRYPAAGGRQAERNHRPVPIPRIALLADHPAARASLGAQKAGRCRQSRPFHAVKPLCIVPSPDETLYVFFAVDGIAPEYRFQASSVRSVEADHPATLEIVKSNADITVQVKEAGTSASFSLKTSSGKKVRVLTLTRQQSLSASRVILGGHSRLLLAPGPVLCEDPSLRLEQTDSNRFTFAIYPNLRLAAESGIPLAHSPDGLLTQYTTTLPAKPAISIDIRPEPDATATISQSYQPDYTPVPDAKTWALQIPPDALVDCRDLCLSIHYTGDTAALERLPKRISEKRMRAPQAVGKE